MPQKRVEPQTLDLACSARLGLGQLHIIQHRRTVCATAQLLVRPPPLVSGHRGRRSKQDERPSHRQHWAAEGVASGRRVGAPARGVLLPKLPG
eukprot:scaffold25898_cov79-Isochrysis_galbana.AAC.2